MSKFTLFNLLGSKDTPYIKLDNKWYILLGVARESGSGSDFNLTLLDNDNKKVERYIRTID